MLAHTLVFCLILISQSALAVGPFSYRRTRANHDRSLQAQQACQSPWARRFSTPAYDPRRVAARSEKNLRAYQEDRFFISPLSATELCVGVCDGHGGETAANFVASRFPLHVKSLLAKPFCDKRQALRQAVLQVESELEEVQKTKKEELCGTTLTAALITQEEICLAQVGDSRAVIWGYEQCAPLTSLHDPRDALEEKRIHEAGGYVMDDGGTARVMGALSMSRALGDFALKPFGVIAEPEITKFRRKSTDYALVLASDGLFETLRFEDIQAILNSSKETQEAAQKLVDEAILRGAQDNITALVVRLLPLFDRGK